MLISDILGSRVIAPDGECVGRVIDVRMVQDGPYIEGFGNALRLDTLIVGRRGTPARLGYVRGGVRGPALVRWLAARIERRALTVGWHEVRSVDADVHIGRAGSELVRLGDAVANW